MYSRLPWISDQVPPPRMAGFESLLLIVGIDTRKVQWIITQTEIEQYRMSFLNLVGNITKCLPCNLIHILYRSYSQEILNCLCS